MQHLISTPFGKVLGIVNEQANTTDIVDALSLKRLARVEGTTYQGMLFAVRRIVSLTRFTNDLANRNIEVFDTFENKTESPRTKRQKKVAEATPVAPAPTASTQVTATPIDNGPKPLVKIVSRKREKKEVQANP